MGTVATLRPRLRCSPCASTRAEVFSPVEANREEDDRRIDGWKTRVAAGHTRPAHPQGAFARGPAWLGDLRAHSAGLERRAPDPTRLALSRPPSPRALRLDQGAMGRVRQQPPGEVLRAHAERSQSARSGNGCLAAAHRRGASRPRNAMSGGDMVADFLSDVRFRLRAVFRQAELERELDDELRYHLDREAEKNARLGLDADEAARRARLAFGGVDR